MFRRKKMGKKQPAQVVVPVQGRVPHNPPQQLITAEEAKGLTAVDLVAAAGSNVPALVSAVSTIATRFGEFVGNIHALNVGLQEFKRDVVQPFREELKHLRYTTGDRLNHASADLESYVAALDRVLWAALRASGMSDEAIRQYRTENGMQPEAPRGRELEIHLEQFESLKRHNAELIEQNRRLLARLGGHTAWTHSGEWSYCVGCQCQVCAGQARALADAALEAQS